MKPPSPQACTGLCQRSLSSPVRSHILSCTHSPHILGPAGQSSTHPTVPVFPRWQAARTCPWKCSLSCRQALGVYHWKERGTETDWQVDGTSSCEAVAPTLSRARGGDLLLVSSPNLTAGSLISFLWSLCHICPLPCQQPCDSRVL